MEAELLSWIRSHDLLAPGDSVTCAVSGGADSMALLCCLLALREELGITLQAAHFNHQLRGAASDGDEAFVRDFCEKNGISCFFGRGDVKLAAEEGKLSTEEAARKLRYDFLLSCPGKIATAHTAEDNCETVLMNLLRGSGLKGLCGIPPCRDRIIRPMLSVTHEEARAYLNSLEQPWREDAGNAEDDYRRNRIRHHLLPLLKEENPAYAQTILRCSESLRGELQYLEEEAEKLLASARCEDGLRCSVLRKANDALLRRALRLHACKDFDAVLTERLLSLIRNGRGSCRLPNGKILTCSCGILMEEIPLSPPVPTMLDKPGESVLFGNYEISCRRIASFQKNADLSSRMPCIRENALPIFIRSRQEGDSIQTPGGRKSLKKLMIDKKIPSPLRESLPVFCCGEEIAAVYRLEVSEPFRAIPGEPCLQISIKKICV